MFFADRVQETSSSTGTGDFALSDPTVGHRAFVGVVPTDEPIYYAITEIGSGTSWETGQGSVNGAGQLVRTIVFASSSGGSLVNFAAGVKIVTLTVGANHFNALSGRLEIAARDGVADDRARFAAADADGAFSIPKGSYLIGSNITIASDVSFDVGATLVIPTGVTVTFSGSVTAGVYQIFSCSGTGKVVFNLRKTYRGFPEWWGAKADLSMDCLSAFHAARDALLLIECQGGDYLISGTLNWNKENRTLRGAGEKYHDTDAEATRILINNGTDTICYRGPTAQPGTINAFLKDINIEKVYFGRTVVPVISSDCRGVWSRWTLYGHLTRVKSDGSMIGFEENGVVHLKKEHCEAVRASAGSGGGTDYFIGHYANGGGSIGAAGGNASLYHDKCSAGCNYGPLQTASGSIGFKADQGFTDVWYRDPETVGFYTGQAVFGNDNAGLVFSNVDFIIEHPIHDQFHFAGIYVTDVAASGCLEIENPYYGPATDARAAYYVNSSLGSVRSSGGQWIMGGAPGVQPVLLDSAPNSMLLGFPAIVEAGNTYPIVSCSNSSNCILTVDARNPTISAGAIIQIIGTVNATVVEPKCSGKAAAFQYGIQVVGTGDTNCEYRVSALSSNALPAATRKLDRNGTAVTAAGLSESNYASGVFT